MLSFIKRIIQRMIDFAKRWGPAFLVAFVASVGLILQNCIYLKSIIITIILVAYIAIIIFNQIIKQFFCLRI